MVSALYCYVGFVVVLVFIVAPLQSCSAKDQQVCVPSSCGKIPNITHPFRLKSDPDNCGDRRYELDCVNNVAVLRLYSAQYLVQAINYNNYTIRLVDPNIQERNCCSIPRYFLYQYNFSEYSDEDFNLYQRRKAETSYPWVLLNQYIIYFKCTNPVSDDASYVDTNSSDDGHNHIYAITGDLGVTRWKPGCSVKVISPTSLWSEGDYGNVSYSDIHRQNVSYGDIYRQLAFGFELSWLRFACHQYCGSRSCFFNDTAGKLDCESASLYCYYLSGTAHKCGIWVTLISYTKAYLYGILKGIYNLITFRPTALNDANPINRAVVVGRFGLPSYVAGRFLFGIIFLIGLLIYKWRRRHLSVYENIENFLQDNSLNPLRYSYKEIKKMTNGFKVKLGEGGFGSVYKGRLRSGPYVAIKMLGKPKAKKNGHESKLKANSGQDFISEVATIGRIHHVNVVRLVGFCVEGSKRALVYEFMPNGSLDKYIFSKEGSIPLSYEKIYEISLRVAHGIAYLHQGCDVQILHFDIKPHNILLDENFNPKVSDFGLAKLYPVNDSIVTLTAARGTIGYMAPELFYKNIGGVSYKADVYSFGMLLMEMASRRRNSIPVEASETYFPLWIYDQFNLEKGIEIKDVTEEEKNVAKKMFIVALWCIQLKPFDRPSMNKVVEMLEGEIESLIMPPKPSLYPHETVTENEGINSDTTAYSDFTGSTTSLGETATDPLLENSA